MPYGQTGPGRIGPDRRRTRARSLPTGWETKQGEVHGQELEFDNGYRVLAVTVPGQKATIKGLDAWANTLKHLDQWTACVREWIASEEKNMRGRKAAEEAEAAAPAPMHPVDAQRINTPEAKVDKLTDNLGKLIEAMQHTR